MSGDRWRGVLAALLNPDLRAVLGEALSGPPLSEPRRARAVTRLVELGVLRETEPGVFVLDDAAIRGILSENPPVKPTGAERFLDADGRIDRYPSQQGDREQLLQWVVERAFGADDVLDEAETNERLARFTGDVAALRRYLVDAGLLERTRSGSEYARPGASPG